MFHKERHLLIGMADIFCCLYWVLFAYNSCATTTFLSKPRYKVTCSRVVCVVFEVLAHTETLLDAVDFGGFSFSLAAAACRIEEHEKSNQHAAKKRDSDFKYFLICTSSSHGC